MLEYAVSLTIGSTQDLILAITITSSLDIAKYNLASTERDIKANKYPVHTSAKLVMREVTPWCEMNMKSIDYKWNGVVTKGC